MRIRGVSAAIKYSEVRPGPGMRSPTGMAKMDRRIFLGATTRMAGGALLGVTESAMAGAAPSGRQARRDIALLLDPADTIAASPPARWAAEQAQLALEARGVTVRRIDRLE